MLALTLSNRTHTLQFYGRRGMLGEELCTASEQGDGGDVMVCVCGPPGFQKKGEDLAKEAGFANVLTW